MSDLESQKRACLKVLAAIANLNGDPTPREFEAFLAALSTFRPMPPGITPETLLGANPVLDPLLPKIQVPHLQQQVYRGAYTIVRSKGIDPQETEALAKIQSTFRLSPDLVAALVKQPLRAPQSDRLLNSALAGMTSLMGREGDVRRLIFDYALGAAIVGLIPITGGGSLEIKLLGVLGLILSMARSIRTLWGKPRGQGVLAVLGNLFGFIGAVVAGLLAWGTFIAVGVLVPYVGAFAKAAGFATATWITGQSTNQFYTSQSRPDLTALKRAFPTLIPPTPPSHTPGQPTSR